MKFTKYKVVSAISLFFCMSACITDPPPIPFTPQSIAGIYKIKQWYAVGSATQFYYLYDSLPLCQKAVEINLRTDLLYTHIHSDSSCTSIYPFGETGKWNAAGSRFLIDSLSFSFPYFDGKQMTLSYRGVYNGDSATYFETLVRQ